MQQSLSEGIIRVKSIGWAESLLIQAEGPQATSRFIMKPLNYIYICIVISHRLPIQEKHEKIEQDRIFTNTTHP